MTTTERTVPMILDTCQSDIMAAANRIGDLKRYRSHELDETMFDKLTRVKEFLLDAGTILRQESDRISIGK